MALGHTTVNPSAPFPISTLRKSTLAILSYGDIVIYNSVSISVGGKYADQNRGNEIMNCALNVLNPTVQGDMELIQQVLLFSSQQAFSELMCRHQSGVKRMLSRFRCIDTVVLEDLVQETFIRAYFSLNSFNAQARFSTWIYRIAFNLAIDYSRKKNITSCALEYADNIPGKCYLDNWELTKDLKKSFQKLNAKQQTAILLCLSEGYTQVEAAELMEIPLGTVKTHVSRAKKLLQQEMTHWRSIA